MRRLLTSIILSAVTIGGSVTLGTVPARALPPEGGAAEAAVTMEHLFAWVDALSAEAIGGYIGAIQAEQARTEALRRSQVAPRVVSQAPIQSTGACGGATNGADRYIARESGGNPGIANPSGAYGCYQIMPGTWLSSCSDLGGEIGSAPSTQAECASRLPLSAWGG